MSWPIEAFSWVRTSRMPTMDNAMPTPARTMGAARNLIAASFAPGVPDPNKATAAATPRAAVARIEPA